MFWLLVRPTSTRFRKAQCTVDWAFCAFRGLFQISAMLVMDTCTCQRNNFSEPGNHPLPVLFFPSGHFPAAETFRLKFRRTLVRICCATAASNTSVAGVRRQVFPLVRLPSAVSRETRGDISVLN